MHPRLPRAWSEVSARAISRRAMCCRPCGSWRCRWGSTRIPWPPPTGPCASAGSSRRPAGGAAGCGHGPPSTARGSLRVEAPAGRAGPRRRQPGPRPAARRSARRWPRPPRRTPGSPASTGTPPWSRELAALARAGLDADGVPAGPVAVTSGSLDAIERVLAAHLRPGDAVAVEDPGWGSLLDLVPALGLRAVPGGPGRRGAAARRGGAGAAGGRAGPGRHRPGAEPDGRRGQRAARRGAARRCSPRTRTCCSSRTTTATRIVDLPLHPLAGVTDSWAFVRSDAKAYGPDLRLAVLTGDARHRRPGDGPPAAGPGLGQPTAAADRRRPVGGRVRSTPAAVARVVRRAAGRAGTGAGRAGVAAYGRSGMNVWVPVADETGAVARLLHAGWAVAPGARFRMASPPGVRLTVSPLSAPTTSSRWRTRSPRAAGPARRGLRPVSYG